MTRPRLLDLFCGEGGAAAGYVAAGFDVLGVDICRKPRYPYPFRRGDALDYLAAHGADFDAVHASPPCKVHTALAGLHRDDLDAMLFPLPTHTDLVPATRQLLNANGRPWIMENVPGAPLVDPVMLCGSMFGLGAVCLDGWRQLRRHRLFESSAPLLAPRPCNHQGNVVGVYGNGGGHLRLVSRGYQADAAEALNAMGTPWMTRRGVSQAIPPAYTEWLGAQLLERMAA